MFGWSIEGKIAPLFNFMVYLLAGWAGGPVMTPALIGHAGLAPASLQPCECTPDCPPGSTDLNTCRAGKSARAFLAGPVVAQLRAGGIDPFRQQPGGRLIRRGVSGLAGRFTGTSGPGRAAGVHVEAHRNLPVAPHQVQAGNDEEHRQEPASA